jgi:hypothetical protein
MRSIGLVIARDILKRNAWSQLLAMTFLIFVWPVLMLFLGSEEGIRHLDNGAFQRLTWILVVMQAVLTPIIVSQSISEIKSRGAGFQVRLYTLPATSGTLVFWHLFWGIVETVLIYLATATLWGFLAGRWPPLLVPALLLATVFAWAMVVLWGLPDFGLLRGVAFALFIMNGAFIYKFYPLDNLWKSPSFLTILVLCGLIVLPGIAATAGVARDRRGDAQGWPGLRDYWRRVLDRNPPGQRHFSSPAAAQFWFEWRLKGWIMPAVMLIPLIVIVGIYIHQPRAEVLLEILSGLLIFGPPLGAFMVGVIIGRCSQTSRQPELDLWRATRPLSDRELAAANLKVGAASVLSGWAMCLVGLLLACGYLVLAGHGAEVRGAWHQLNDDGGWASRGLAFLPIYSMLSLAVAWLLVSLMISFTMAGHEKAMVRATLTLIFLFIALVIGGRWLPQATGVFLALAIPVVLGGVGLAGAAAALAVARGQDLIGPRFFWISTLIAACIITIVSRLSNDIPARWLFFYMGITVLAAAIPAVATLAMAWNRHR